MCLHNPNDFIIFARFLYSMKRFVSIFCLCAFLVAVSTSCRRARVPKPYGYFRVEIPDTAYAYADLDGYPYQFLLSKNAIVKPREKDGECYWIDIQYPTLNATIHCSYKVVKGNLRSLSKDAQEFLYGHSTVASAIPVQEYLNDDHRTYGLYYELHGNTATPYQFYLTDSVHHFFRGSVYCNTIPNQDSLAPIYEYLRKDVRVMMESMVWR
jgi:gliding motility-associated lipoprotein GldD